MDRLLTVSKWQFTASMWTPEQAQVCRGAVVARVNYHTSAPQEIVGIAKAIVPGIKTFSIPQGLQVEKGPDAVVEYIEENLPALLDS